MGHLFYGSGFSSQLLGVAAGLLTASGVAAWSVHESEVIAHHSADPPFLEDWWQGGIPYWDFGGDAVVTEDYIRLTPNKQSRDGWLWNDEPNDIPEWEARMAFRIHASHSVGADGIAFWYVESPVKTVGDLWGSPSVFKGIGIIFDTYDNDATQDSPSVTVIKNDGTKSKWDTNRDLKHDGILRCVYQFRNTDRQEPVWTRVQYKDNSLKVWLKTGISGAETLCGTAYNLDLPRGYFFGVTATTGGLADTHDIYSFVVTPAEGVHLPDGPEEHHPIHDPRLDAEQKKFWRAKTPEEEAEEKRQQEAKRQQEEAERIENERVASAQRARPPQRAPAPAPVPVPQQRAPAPVPVPQQRAPAPVPQQRAPVPVPQPVPVPVPVPQQRAPVPVPQQRPPVPVPQPVPVPVPVPQQRAPVSAPVPVPQPVPVPVPVPQQEAPVPVPVPQPVPVPVPQQQQQYIPQPQQYPPQQQQQYPPQQPYPPQQYPPQQTSQQQQYPPQQQQYVPQSIPIQGDQNQQYQQYQQYVPQPQYVPQAQQQYQQYVPQPIQYPPQQQQQQQYPP